MTYVADFHKKAVEKLLAPIRTRNESQHIYILWPNLYRITERFCNFVSPLMPSVTGDPLAHVSIQSAIRAYNQENDENLKPRAYIVGLIDAVGQLAELEVQGVKEDGVVNWEPYIEPMCDWMVHNRIVTVRSRWAPNTNQLAAKQAVLCHTVTSKDMAKMDIALSTFAS